MDHIRQEQHAQFLERRRQAQEMRDQLVNQIQEPRGPREQQRGHIRQFEQRDVFNDFEQDLRAPQLDVPPELAGIIVTPEDRDQQIQLLSMFSRAS